MMPLPLDQKSALSEPPQMQLRSAFFRAKNIFEKRVVL
jgi:hypothetical protein